MKSFALVCASTSQSQRNDELAETQLTPSGKCIHCISSLFSVMLFVRSFWIFLSWQQFDASIVVALNRAEILSQHTNDRTNRSTWFHLPYHKCLKVLQHCHYVSQWCESDVRLGIRICMWLCGLIATLIRNVSLRFSDTGTIFRFFQRQLPLHRGFRTEGVPIVWQCAIFIAFSLRRQRNTSMPFRCAVCTSMRAILWEEFMRDIGFSCESEWKFILFSCRDQFTHLVKTEHPRCISYLWAHIMTISRSWKKTFLLWNECH